MMESQRFYSSYLSYRSVIEFGKQIPDKAQVLENNENAVMMSEQNIVDRFYSLTLRTIDNID